MELINHDALEAARQHNPRDPGKFEAESASTVYYYYCTLDGDNGVLEFSDPEEVIFQVTADEARELDIPSPYFGLQFLDSGFVVGSYVSEAEYRRLCKVAEEEVAGNYVIEAEYQRLCKVAEEESEDEESA